RIQLKIILFFSTLFFSACEFVSEVDVDYSGSRVVLNGIVNADSLFYIHLAYTWNSRIESRPGHSGVTRFIEDAEVSLSVNDQPAGSLAFCGCEGKYCLSGYQPAAGDKIALTVKVPGQDDLYTETRVPAKSHITHIDTTMTLKESIWEDGYVTGFMVDMNIRTEKKKKNYYLLAFSSWMEYQFRNEGEEDEKQLFIVNPSMLLRNEEIHSHPETYYMQDYMYSLGTRKEDIHLFSSYVIFSDDAFKEEEYQLSVELRNIAFSYSGEEFSSLSHFHTRLFTISSSFYLYLQSRYLQYTHESVIFPAQIEDQIPTFSNIEGGYGLFSVLYEESVEMTFAPMDIMTYPYNGYYHFYPGGYGNGY
ncbi:MAG: DUF4249 domain-containing protein, partial [Tannerellaceae bacterium]|nr:DUF4249 domain-containing protein [Tannerellaceae bacterium]